MDETRQQPIPQGKYRPAVRHGDLIYTSGMTPREAGVLKYSGTIRADDPLEAHQDAVRLAADNAVTAAEGCLEARERLAMVLQLNVFLNAEQGFTSHAKLADSASDTIARRLGVEAIGSRAAIGVATLPSNAPVEITLTALVGPS